MGWGGGVLRSINDWEVRRHFGRFKISDLRTFLWIRIFGGFLKVEKLGKDCFRVDQKLS